VITGTKVSNPKTALGSSPGEDVFCPLETNDGRRTWIRPTLFISVRRLKEQTPQPRKKCPGLEFW
jgi:hypothetical protein